MNIEELKSKTISELTNIAKTLKIQGHSGLRKQDLIFRILEAKTKKDGLILVVNLNNQNLVLKGFWDIKYNCWKLFPYYDKTKTNPQFNRPQQPRDEMDDQLPQSEKEWANSPAPDPTDFNPEQYEDNHNS